MSNNYEPLSNLRVLLIEDNKINQQVIKMTTSQWNVNLVVAETGMEGLREFEQNEFDVILLDLQLPDISGYSLAEKFQSSSNLIKRKTPIIAVTGTLTHDSEVAVQTNKFAEAIQKPFLPEVLKTKLTTIALAG